MAHVNIRLFSSDWYWVTGRGAVAAISKRVWPFDPAELINQEVLIDNKRFLVNGIERWAMQWRTEADWPIGILVHEIDENEVSLRMWRRTDGPKTYEDVVRDKHNG